MTPLEPLSNAVNQKYKLSLRCTCGKQILIRASDLIHATPKGCKSCAMRRGIKEGKRFAFDSLTGKAASNKATAVITKKWTEEERRVASIVSGAKQRCTNKQCKGYENYGARGIKFLFASVEEATKKVVASIGLPKANETLARIDNNGHYEIENLRWATRTAQTNNKRPYRKRIYGARLTTLMAQRPDLSYETIRSFINEGRTDKEIIEHEKYRHRVRHTKLRTS